MAENRQSESTEKESSSVEKPLQTTNDSGQQVALIAYEVGTRTQEANRGSNRIRFGQKHCAVCKKKFGIPGFYKQMEVACCGRKECHDTAVAVFERNDPLMLKKLEVRCLGAQLQARIKEATKPLDMQLTANHEPTEGLTNILHTMTQSHKHDGIAIKQLELGNPAYTAIDSSKSQDCLTVTDPNFLQRRSGDSLTAEDEGMKLEQQHVYRKDSCSRESLATAQHQLDTDWSRIGEIPESANEGTSRYYDLPTMVHPILKISEDIPFIKPVKVLQASNKGIQYSDFSLGLCIDIPQGAIPEGSLLHLEIGMCLYGPFKFPNEVYPITPILMLCPQTEIRLKKPLKVTIPHIIHDPQNIGVEVLKADHTRLLLGKADCIFDEIVKNSYPSFHTCNGKGYVTFTLQHFCFVTVRANNTIVEAEKAGYCICPVFPSPRTVVSPGEVFYFLCVTYCMDPCIKAIQEQYSTQGYEVRISRIREFRFKDAKRAILQAKLQDLPVSGWVALLNSEDGNGGQVISANSVNVWSKQQTVLEDEIKLFLYPPCIKINILIPLEPAPTAILKIRFSTSTNVEDDFTINLPLDHNVLSHLEGYRSTTRPSIATSKQSSDDSELEQDDLAYLSRYFDNVEFYFDTMKLTPSEKSDVKSAVQAGGNQLGMNRCLECWYQHNPSAATFPALRTMLHKLGKETIASKVDEYMDTYKR